MDFGDYSYIIIAVVFSALSALSKKRKKRTSSGNGAVKRDFFQQLFNDDAVIEDPVPRYYTPDEMLQFEQDIDQTLQEEAVPMTFEETVLRRKEENKSSFVEQKKKKNEVPKHKEVIRHPILAGLNSRTEVQRAIVYAELLKRKY